MGTMYNYKPGGFSRQHRLQNIEEHAAMGMQYTNTPLPEGYNKLLVNFDLKDKGNALTPRPGLRVAKLMMPDSTVSAEGAQEIVYSAKEQYRGSKTMPQFLLNQALTATDIPNLYESDLLCMTADTDVAEGAWGVPEKTYYSIKQPGVSFVGPASAEIHGIPLKDTKNLARGVGTYAWNGDYYCVDHKNAKLMHTKFNDETSKFEFKEVEPKELSPKEAVTYGYNMLLANPYVFVNKDGPVGTPIQLLGLLPYDKDGKLTMSPSKNQDLTFEAFYQAPAKSKYKFVWEWRETTASTWEKLKEETLELTDVNVKVKAEFTPPADSIIMRLTAFKDNEQLAASALAVGFNFKKSDYGATANIDTKTYNLFNCTGMTYWQHRLVMWGSQEDATILFASDVNNPAYFPYPNSTDTFDEPIKYAVPFMDKLLVFTSSKLYSLTLNEDGRAWTKSLLQNNLTIADWDIHLIQVVKNMVFFRSGNYFYMIVPKVTSLTGELTIAAITKPMYNFFDNFAENVKDIMKQMYNYEGTLQLTHYYDYLDFEDVHVCYIFKTDTNEYLNFCALYNTVDRSWRVYVLGSSRILTPYRQDATQKGALCTAFNYNSFPAIEILVYNNKEASDIYFPDNSSADTWQALLKKQHWLFNWQTIDTGYREHNSNFKKRYREIQFVLNNVSNRKLEFYSDFVIDGELRQSQYQYNVVRDEDPESPNYGVVTVERTLVDPYVVPGATILAEDRSQTGLWQLDLSAFPDVSFVKVRFPVSGKGYVPRLQIVSHNEQFYELLNISWIYRALYSR